MEKRNLRLNIKLILKKSERNIYSKLSYDELKKIIHTGTNNSKVLREIGIEKEKKYLA